MATFTGTARTDNTFVGTAKDDLFQFAAADINARDSVTGGGGIDRLQLTSAGLLADTALAGIRGVNQIALANGTNAIKLTDDNFVGLYYNGRISVFGGSGNDRIDASSLTETKDIYFTSDNSVTIFAGAGQDVLLTGNGYDKFYFMAADLAGDTVSGGDELDTLILTSSGALAAGALSGLSQVETIELAAGGNAITMLDVNFTGVSDGRIFVRGTGSGSDVVDASGLSSANSVQIVAGAGRDVLRGGAGVDSFLFTAAELAGDTVSGGDGSDRLGLYSGGALAADALAGLSHVETIGLSRGGNAITLLDANFTGVSDGRITVRGARAGNDVVDASGLSSAHGVTVLNGAGRDILRGGGGRDFFSFDAADMARGTVSGGGNVDTLLLVGRGALAAGALAGLSQVETIVLAPGGNAITMLDANFTGVSGGRIMVRGTRSGNDVVDASGLTGARSVDVTAGAGADVLSGGAGNDVFRFTAASMAGDTVVGGLGRDRLVLTTGGALGTGGITRVSGVETIALAAGGNPITLTNANFVGVTGAKIVVTGGAGDNTVNAAGLTGMNRIDVTAGAGFDTLRGGAGADVFRFAFLNLRGDVIAGGAGSDTLLLTTAGGLPSNALRSMTGVERMLLAADGNAITLENANFAGVAGAKITVVGVAGAGANTVNASGLTGANAIDVTAGGGLDVLRGGAGNDVFRFTTARLDGDTVQGGGGIDTLLLTTTGGLGGTALAHVTGVETIRFATGGNSLALIDANFAGVAGGVIKVIGGGGPNLVDAGQLTGSNSIDVTAGKDTDSLTGGAGDDVFRFARLYLTADDTVTGGTGYDILVLSDTGALASDALAGVTGIDRISLAAGGNSLTLTDANFAVPFVGGGRQLSIVASAGSSVIDGFSLTGTNGLYIYDRGGVDTIIGGAGADYLEFNSGAVFAAGDTFDGGAGVDAIFFDRSMDFLGSTISNVEQLLTFGSGSTSVTISGENAEGFDTFGSFASNGVNNIFNIQLAGNSNTDLSNLTLLNGDAGDAIHVVNSGGDRGGTKVTTLSSSIASYTGNDSIDYVYDRGGVQTISLGRNNDTVAFRNGNFFAPGDTIDGGAGDDTVTFDRSMNFLGDSIKNVENLEFFFGGAADIKISGEIAAQLKVIRLYNSGDTAQVFTIQLAAGSTTDLSNLSFSTADPISASDALKVVSHSGNTKVTLNDQFASFTGSDDSDTVALLVGGAYRSGAVIDGGGGDDRIVFSKLPSLVLDGGTGNDTLVLLGTASIDLAGDSSQSSEGNTVNNFENIDGSASSVIVDLQGRNDLRSILIGGSAADVIRAGNFGSTITGGLGADDLYGGSGDDRFHIRSTAEAASDTIGGAGGDDGIDVLGSADLTGAAISGIETLFLAAADAAGNFTADDLTATVTGAQAAALTDVFGNGYNTTSVEKLVVKMDSASLDLSGLGFSYWGAGDMVEINGTAGDDVITGTSANDVINGGGGFDRISGGNGDDQITFYARSTLSLDGGEGSDTILIDNSRGYYLTIDLNSQTITKELDSFDPEVITTSGFDNVLNYNNFYDSTILGNDNANILFGGLGLDAFFGGIGADTLTGGSGADRFGWTTAAEGGDTITDFEQGTDKLVFTSEQFGVVGAFDTAVDADPGANVDLSSADLVYTGERLNSTAEVRSFVDGQNASASHGMFVFALNSAGHAVLYYSSNASDAPGAVGDTAFYQIADLGTGPFADVGLFMGSFIFV